MDAQTRHARAFVRGRRNPAWHIVLPIIALIAAGLALTAAYLPHAMQAGALDAAYRSSVQLADLIKITRGYYTQNVIPKAMNSGVLYPAYQHKNDPHAIPLPATFVMDISDLLKEKETSLSLVSPYPWPHRADRKMDAFELEAWEAFQENPSSAFSRLETKDGKRILRVAVADRMTAQTCVDCHNAQKTSTKRDWALGDVRAVMQVSKVVEPYLAQVDQRSAAIIVSLAVVGVIVSALLIGFAALVGRRTREKRASDDYIRFMAHHDAMTGLLNRTSFVGSMNQMLDSAVTKRSRLAVYFIDLDRFKEVNDKFGHGAGDRLVNVVAERLRSVTGSADLLARFGGDEFAVAQVGSELDVGNVAENIVRALSRPYTIGNHQVCISASVGVKLTSYPPEPASDLLQAADIALYRAKALGRNRAIVFTPEMRDESRARHQLEQIVRSACENESFELHFQPIHRVADGRLEGFEALLRLTTPEGKVIPPDEFIPVAEQIGLIGNIGKWVIAHACATARHWPDGLTVAVNLSPAQFGATQAESICAIVNAALRESGLAPRRLELEITENLVLEDTEQVIAELRQLKQIGISLVMDDFGTGYSSLSYLWKLPFDKIKIDRSFIAALGTENPNIQQILKTIAAFGRTLNLAIVAEGIETREQVELFSNIDCDQIQGYYFSRPMPTTAVAGYIMHDYRRHDHLLPLFAAADRRVA